MHTLHLRICNKTQTGVKSGAFVNQELVGLPGGAAFTLREAQARSHTAVKGEEVDQKCTY